jgi:1-acyl-sn-glycerol-3-phosphate acyltransferase
VGAPAEKPRAEIFRPELVYLPELTPGRRFFRFLAKWFCRFLLFLLTRTKTAGLKNLPQKGPALLVVNHLGDADGVFGMAYFPPITEAMGKMELYFFPVLGWIMRAYGTIWVHRGVPDRRALRAGLQALAEGRLLAIAPEGRESLTGALEEGTGGAAYIALKANVPVVPVTFTGTQNSHVYNSLLRLRRPRLTMTVGPAFHLEAKAPGREAVAAATKSIMIVLAKQLPEEYRGVYRDLVD